MIDSKIQMQSKTLIRKGKLSRNGYRQGVYRGAEQSYLSMQSADSKKIHCKVHVWKSKRRTFKLQ